jgi:hypothetical protein
LGGIVSGAFSVLATLVLLGVASIVHPPLIPLVAGLVLCAFPLAFAALGWKNAVARTSQVTRALDEAWFLAARDLVRRKGIMPTAELAESMRIDHVQAERIMARLGALDELHSDITDSGDLAVSLQGAARVRVASATDPATPVTELAEQPAAESNVSPRGKVGA